MGYSIKHKAPMQSVIADRRQRHTVWPVYHTALWESRSVKQRAELCEIKESWVNHTLSERPIGYSGCDLNAEKELSSGK